MRVLFPVLVCLFAVSGGAQAQVRSVEVRTPRAFGYVLGDVVLFAATWAAVERTKGA